ncbi:MAG: cytochrome P450 [Polyangiaceae bacterium]
MLLGEVELYNPDVYVTGVPHEAFRLLRKEAPVHFQKEPNGRGYYAITKYEDIVNISKNPKTVSSYHGTNIEEYPPEALEAVRMLMVNMDPPQHNKFRKLASVAFTPRVVKALEPAIRERARKILDEVQEKKDVDVVSQMAGELPLQVICDLGGVPQEDRHLIFDWSNRLIGFDDPEFQTSFEDGTIAAAEVWQYANQLAEGRKGKTGDDLVTLLINAEIDGTRLTEMEFDAFFLMLMVAGNETTRNLISGGLLALLENPAEQARLVQDPSLVPSAVEEMLRWVTPVMYFRRTTTTDVEIRGVKIKEGEKVVMYYPSANRDEDIFKDPYKFDVGRTPNEHLAFGTGQHFCLGASLARLEIRIMFEELIKRLPKCELTGKARRLRSNFINGYKEIPARFAP